jgi:hypothetical protein
MSPEAGRSRRTQGQQASQADREADRPPRRPGRIMRALEALLVFSRPRYPSEIDCASRWRLFPVDIRGVELAARPAGHEPGGREERWALVADLHSANAPAVRCHDTLANQITAARIVIVIVAAIAVGVAVPAVISATIPVVGIR